jgi:MraZ protein
VVEIGHQWEWIPKSGTTQKESTVRPLFGNYELTLDEKNRLLVPSDIRKAWNPEDAESLVIVPGVNGKLWLYTEKFYEVMAAKMESELAPEEDKVLNDQLNFGTAQRVEMDKSGRVLIPEKLVRKGRLEREVTVLGIRDHVEIWNRGEWNAHEEDLETRRAEITARAKRSSKSAGSATVGGLAQQPAMGSQEK